MATVRRRGASWQATVRGPDGRERTKTEKLKIEAQRWADTQEADKARGEWIDHRLGRTTFGDYSARWRARQVYRETTAAEVESHLRRHVLPMFGNRPLASIRPGEIQAAVKGWAITLSPATVDVVARYLAAILRAAVEDGMIARSPFRGVRLPKAAPVQVEPLSTDAVMALVETIPDRYRALVVTAAGTGLRQGEGPHRAIQTPLLPSRYRTRSVGFRIPAAVAWFLADQPANDRDHYLEAWSRTLQEQGGYSPKEADAAALAVLPDVLRYDRSLPAVYPNGRMPVDDVYDAMLTLCPKKAAGIGPWPCAPELTRKGTPSCLGRWSRRAGPRRGQAGTWSRSTSCTSRSCWVPRNRSAG